MTLNEALKKVKQFYKELEEKKEFFYPNNNSIYVIDRNSFIGINIVGFDEVTLEIVTMHMTLMMHQITFSLEEAINKIRSKNEPQRETAV